MVSILMEISYAVLVWFTGEKLSNMPFIGQLIFQYHLIRDVFRIFSNIYDRSSHRRCSVWKVFLVISKNPHEKKLCQSLFLNKFASLWPATLLKRDYGAGFFCGFCEISKNIFFTEHLWVTDLFTTKQMISYFLSIFRNVFKSLLNVYDESFSENS